MSGGNPNHDPRTGRFASKDGLNSSNSTATDRAKSHAKSAVKGAVAFAGILATAAIGAVAHAAVSGVAKSVKKAAVQKTAAFIDTHSATVERHTANLTDAAIKTTSAAAAHAAARAGTLARAAAAKMTNTGRAAISSVKLGSTASVTAHTARQSRPAPRPSGGPPMRSRQSTRPSNL